MLQLCNYASSVHCSLTFYALKIKKDKKALFPVVEAKMSDMLNKSNLTHQFSLFSGELFL